MNTDTLATGNYVIIKRVKSGSISNIGVIISKGKLQEAFDYQVGDTVIYPIIDTIQFMTTNNGDLLDAVMCNKIICILIKKKTN